MPNQPKPAPGTSGRYISKVPDDLWQQAREKALREGTSISAVVIEFLSDWTNDSATAGINPPSGDSPMVDTPPSPH